jgi:hypothetical protein
MKQIIKKFNNLIKETILKVQNKTNDNFNISTLSKCLISFVVVIFVYLFYLLIPLMYDKSWLQSSLEKKLLDEFKINLSTSADISYRILPAPHFLIKDSKIFVNKGDKKNSIAEIKDFKVFLNQAKFFNREKMIINKIIIDNANFTLMPSNLQLLKNFRNAGFSKKKIKIKDSKFFFKNNLKEVISIITIERGDLFFDDKKLLNLFNLKGRIFNIPFKLNFMSNKDNNYEEINISSKSLKLDIINKLFIKKNNQIEGENIISFLNNKINTKYDVDNKLIIFKSKQSKINNTQVSYNGMLSINPFDFDSKVYLNDYKILKLISVNSIFTEFIKSELLFNNNISVNTSMLVNSKKINSFFKNAKINFNVVSGKINLDKTKFDNDDIASLELDNSNLYLKGNNLVFNSDIIIAVKNSDRLFSFLNTKKYARKNIKNVLINFEYNFLSDQVELNKIIIDNNQVSDQFLNTAQEFKDINSNTLFKTKRFINKLLNVYEG